MNIRNHSYCIKKKEYSANATPMILLSVKNIEVLLKKHLTLCLKLKTILTDHQISIRKEED